VGEDRWGLLALSLSQDQKSCEGGRVTTSQVIESASWKCVARTLGFWSDSGQAQEGGWHEVKVAWQVGVFSLRCTLGGDRS
jgi:hypothetical protein